MIDAPGIYNIPEAEYHKDPAVEASLSAGVCKILCDRTPAHARLAHPRLNPHYEAPAETTLDIGSAAHCWLLEGDINRFEIIYCDSYRTNAAKEMRDQAYIAGKIPLLEKHWDVVSAMAKAAKSQIAACGISLEGKVEQSIFWQEKGTWCRIRPDLLPTSGPFVYDYKTTEGGAGPDDWGRTVMFNMGNDIRAAFYSRGVAAVCRVEQPTYRFIVQEREPPYALAIHELSPQAHDIAERKVDYALSWWRWCIKHNKWPGYAAMVHYIDPPIFQEQRWIAKETAKDVIGLTQEQMFAKAIEMQEPLE